MKPALPITLLVLVLGAAAPWLISAYELSLLGRFLAFSLVALGIMLTWGEGGILSLGQGVFFGLGGYALAMHLKLEGLDIANGDMPDFMTWSGVSALPTLWRFFVNPWLSLVYVVLVPGLFAAFFGWLVFRRRIGGVYFALITQALALAFATLLVSQQALTGGFNGLTNFSTFAGYDITSQGAARVIYLITFMLVVAAYFALRWLLATRFGTMLRATRDGENRIRFLGHNPLPYKVVAFTIAGSLSGIGGALFTLHAGVISPALVGVVPSIEMVVWVAVGGRGVLWGAIAGTLLVNFAKDEISSALPSLWLYALGALFVLVVSFLPGGIAGMFSNPRLPPRLLRRRQEVVE
ncbi:urea ABC transporter permease subunit UrtC [Acidocella facilis]|uniref:urea ABC transporter permease subunit UrtC n=1 Tax=Acidocella facilis TaxID=525 RepID=UPI00055730C3|nr:urea ABC transporter permease subunit UrtC [Acidocella facilis]